MNTIVTGNDVAIPAALKRTINKIDIPVSISAAATVKAVLVNATRTETLTDTVTLNDGVAGSDWANGIVIVQFDAVSTKNIEKKTGNVFGQGTIEVQVSDPNNLGRCGY